MGEAQGVNARRQSLRHKRRIVITRSARCQRGRRRTAKLLTLQRMG
jgi:hypothetical protein